MSNCNPVFPEGTNADTHYRIKDFKCDNCDCPVEERPKINPRGLSYGTITIQDSASYTDISENKERSGLVRYAEELVPKINRKNQKNNSFSVNIFYKDYKYVFSQNSKLLTTNLQTEYSKNFNRISSSNVVSDIKSFVSQYSGCEEAYKLRKRIIALSKLKGSVSDVVFRFGVEQL